MNHNRIAIRQPVGQALLPAAGFPTLIQLATQPGLGTSRSAAGPLSGFFRTHTK
jgi:hypothetical protein